MMSYADINHYVADMTSAWPNLTQNLSVFLCAIVLLKGRWFYWASK